MGEPPEGQLNGVVAGGGTMIATPTSETVGSKRQRRPSVRLGDIGGDHHHHHHHHHQSYDSLVRRNTIASNATKQFKHHLHMANADHKKDASKLSKIRALTNLNPNSGELNETLDENLDSIVIGSWKLKDSKKRGSAKRVRTNWVSKNNESGPDNINKSGEDVNNNFEVGDSKYSGGEDMEDDYRDFDMENSESSLKEHSPVHSHENLAVDGHARDVPYYNRRGPIRGSRGHNDEVELSGPSDNDAREWNRVGSEDGVRIWLDSLGLGRYAPVFEVHEVDDEVLPMLTLEDLKDMGINAVGSRRKMYCAIQKLGKGFS